MFTQLVLYPDHFLTQSTSICRSTLPHESNDNVLWSSFKSLKVSCWEPCIPLDAKMKLPPGKRKKVPFDHDRAGIITSHIMNLGNLSKTNQFCIRQWKFSVMQIMLFKVPNMKIDTGSLFATRGPLLNISSKKLIGPQSNILSSTE